MFCRTLLASAHGPMITGFAVPDYDDYHNDIALPRPDSYSVGNTFLAFVWLGMDAGNWTAPAGWDNVLNRTTTPAIGIWKKTATDSEPADYTFSNDEGLARLRGVILVCPMTEVEEVGSVGTSIEDNNIVAGGVTIPAGGGIALAAYHSYSGTSPYYEHWTVPSGMAQLNLGENGWNPYFALFTQRLAPGASGTRTARAKGAAMGTNSGVMLALKQG